MNLEYNIATLPKKCKHQYINLSSNASQASQQILLPLLFSGGLGTTKKASFYYAVRVRWSASAPSCAGVVLRA